MSKSLPPLWLTQLFDNNGDLLAGGQVYTYAAGTTTPLATYSNSTGSANTNPVVLDSAARANIFLTPDVGYKFVVQDADDNVLLTVDNIISASGTASSSTSYEVNCSYVGTPGAQGTMAVHQAIRTATFPVDFSGADASVGTNPGADYVVSIQKNGTEIGTVTFDTSGVPTLATAGGATQAIAFGDRITFVGPDTVGTAADFGITLVATL
jgi:hypothetical protein